MDVFRWQDLLDYVTYAGGVGRRRADAVIGLGTAKKAILEAVKVANVILHWLFDNS